VSATLTILLLTVAGHEASDPFTLAVARATREALGSDTQVVVRPLRELPSDADAATLGVQLHADAVVELSWSMPDHLHANIHLRREPTDRWVDREVGFRTTDDPVERGRTVAFVVVSMLPERLRAEAPTAHSEGRADSDGPRSPSPSPPVGPHRVGALAGMFILTMGVGDRGGGAGGALDFRARLGRAFALRLGAGARAGTDPQAHAALRFFYGAAGIAWDAWTTTNARAVFGFRWDALLARADFANFSAESMATEHAGKWMPGADLLVETTYFVTSGIAIVGNAGVEATFGKTDVFIAGQLVRTVEPFHPLLELGFRAGF
jgi:hypothetical protein